jgi:hypothetical protein
MNLIKKLGLIVLMCLGMMGCVIEADAQVPVQNGCVIVVDQFGEREVCSYHYAHPAYGVVYWDPAWRIWVGSRGYYWQNRVWYRGFPNGYAGYYSRWYRPYGYYRYYHRWR